VSGAGPIPVAAQRPDPLAALVAEALRNNLGLSIERLEEERTAHQVTEARGLFFPAVTLDSRYTEQSGTLNFGDFVNPAYRALNQVLGSNRFPTDLDLTLPLAHESRVRLAQPIFNRAIQRNYAIATKRREGQRYRRLAAGRRLAAEVQIGYLALADARAAAAIYESALTLVTEGERVADRLLQAGRATPDAVFRARAERSDVAQKLLEARDQVDASARSLNRLLGRDLDTPIPAIPDSALWPELPGSESIVTAKALADREELRESDASVAASDAAVGLATAAFFPTVALAVDYGSQGQQVRFGGRDDFGTASVVVSWNLFNGGRDVARRQAARADATRARLARRDLEDRIRLEVRNAYSAAVVTRDAIPTADDRLASARRTYELVRRRYEEGVASQIELLDTRTQLTNAELNRALTMHRYLARYVTLERAAALRAME
jgi:outer membrane protein TolC